MRIKRLRYLQQKLQQRLKFKSILLTFFTAILLSACGIKGDLYQTPDPVVVEEDKVVEQSEANQDKAFEKNIELQNKLEKKQEIQSPTEQVTVPAAKPSTVEVKE